MSTVGGAGMTAGLVLDDSLVIKPTSFWIRFRALFRQSRLFDIGLALVSVAIFLAVFGPLIAPYNPVGATGDVNLPPGAAHWFGTDVSGFDVFSRTIAAARIDISIALLATVLSFTFGSVIGLLSTYYGGRAGELVGRFFDMFQAFPLFVLAIIYVTMAGRDPSNIIVVVAVLNIPTYNRLIRTQVLIVREKRYVEAARANGDTSLSIAFRHVLVNSISPCLAQASITLGWAILLTSGLSFVGAGVRPPTPEWGSMIATGANGMILGKWWMAVFPGVVMSLSVFGFAAVAEGVQSILLHK
jgi:peptide/nickel transport system permease protein